MSRLAAAPQEAEVQSRAARLKLFLLDVDGVLTDGSVIYTEQGVEIKAFHIQDGLGLKLLQQAAVEVGLITARRSEMVRRRAEEIGLSHVYQGVRHKLEVFQRLLAQENLRPEEVGYMGDDWLDLPLLIRAGLAATVADAVDEVKERAHYVASRPGGRGAVREVCDLILRAQGKKEALLADFLR